MLISSLLDLRQNQNPETILICTVVPHVPHDNIAWIHMCDECLFDRIFLDLQVPIKCVDTKTPACRHVDKNGISHVMSGTIIFIRLTSTISAYSAALRISAWRAAPKRCKNRKERTASWHSQSRRRWTWPSLSRQVLRLCRIRCVEKPGDTRSTLSNRLVKYRETWRKRTQSRRSVEFSRMAKRCSSGRKYEETRSDRRRPETPELSWGFSKYEATRRFKKLRNRRRRQSLATQSPNINKLRAAHGEGFLDRETKIWSQPNGSNARPRCEDSCVVFFLCLSLLKLQFILVNTFLEILRSTTNQPKKYWRQLFQATERLSTYQTEINGLATIDSQQPRWRETTLLTDRAGQFATATTYVFSDSVLCLGGISTEPVKAWESRIKWFLETRCLKDLDRTDGEPTEFEWQNFQGFTTLEFSTRFIRWWLNQSVNQSNSKEWSSSCQCTMTWIGENDETKNIVLRMLTELLSVLEDSREDVPFDSKIHLVCHRKFRTTSFRIQAPGKTNDREEIILHTL